MFQALLALACLITPTFAGRTLESSYVVQQRPRLSLFLFPERSRLTELSLNGFVHSDVAVQVTFAEFVDLESNSLSHTCDASGISKFKGNSSSFDLAPISSSLLDVSGGPTRNTTFHFKLNELTTAAVFAACPLSPDPELVVTFSRTYRYSHGYLDDALYNYMVSVAILILLPQMAVSAFFFNKMKTWREHLHLQQRMCAGLLGLGMLLSLFVIVYLSARNADPNALEFGEDIPGAVLFYVLIRKIFESSLYFFTLLCAMGYGVVHRTLAKQKRLQMIVFVSADAISQFLSLWWPGFGLISFLLFVGLLVWIWVALRDTKASIASSQRHDKEAKLVMFRKFSRFLVALIAMYVALIVFAIGVVVARVADFPYLILVDFFYLFFLTGTAVIWAPSPVTALFSYTAAAGGGIAMASDGEMTAI